MNTDFLTYLGFFETAEPTIEPSGTRSQGNELRGSQARSAPFLDDIAELELDVLEELYLGGRQHEPMESLHKAEETVASSPELDNDIPPEIKADAKDLGIWFEESSKSYDDLLAEAEIFFSDMGNQYIPERGDNLLKFLKESPSSVLPEPQELDLSDPRHRALFERTARFDSVRRTTHESAPRRILRGFAVLVINACDGEAGGLTMAAQYALDAERLSRSLDQLGFSEVQVLYNVTRLQLLEYLDSLRTALGKGGNLDGHDGLLIYIAGSGGAFTVDCAPGSQTGVGQEKPVHFQEILGRFKNTLVGKPKLLFAHICCDPAERASAKVEYSFDESCCSTALFDDLLEDSYDTMIIFCSTKGAVNWVPCGGSLVINMLLESFKQFCHDLDVDSIIAMTRTQIIEHFIRRRGLGSAGCLVGLSAYETFFMQQLTVFKHIDLPLLAFGPALVFSKQLTDPLLALSMTDSCVSKTISCMDNLSLHACAQLPLTLSGLGQNIAWEFVIMNLDGADDLVLGLVLEKEGFGNRNRYPNQSSPPQSTTRTRRSSMTDNQSQESLFQQQRPGVTIGWGISASGILYPGEIVHRTCFGKGDIIEFWVDRSMGTLEFAVNGSHSGHVFQDPRFTSNQLSPTVVMC